MKSIAILSAVHCLAQLATPARGEENSDSRSRRLRSEIEITPTAEQAEEDRLFILYAVNHPTAVNIESWEVDSVRANTFTHDSRSQPPLTNWQLRG